MKSILIVSHALEIGGAEKALLGLLENIDTTKYEVDLFLLRHQGDLMSYIPGNINLLPEIKQFACLAIPITHVIKKFHFKVALGRWKGKRAAKKRVAELGLGHNDVFIEYSHKFSLSAMPQISNKEYDVAISFLTPHYFVTERVIAKYKIAWIHTDYSVVQVDKKSQLSMWNKYDRIVSISDQAAAEFKKIFPSLETKVITIQNIIPMRYINELVNEFSAKSEMPDENSVKLLSIGRFCTAKNFDNVPEICSKLINMGLKVKWYLIGFGGMENLINQRIIDFGMQNKVIVLGKKENPYPYFKECDIYIQPSRYEGRCVSVTEAQLLNKPVIITNYATSQSQLKDGYDGVIVPMDNDGCAQGIAKVVMDKELQKKLINNTKLNDYSNANEIEKLYKLF